MTRLEVKSKQAYIFGVGSTLPEICQTIMSDLRRQGEFRPSLPDMHRWLSFLDGVLTTWQASDDLYDGLVADMVSCVADKLREEIIGKEGVAG